MARDGASSAGSATARTRSQTLPKTGPAREFVLRTGAGTPGTVHSIRAVTETPASADERLSMMNAALEQLILRAHQMGVHFVELRPGYVRAEVLALVLEAEVSGADGEVVARTRGDYQIRPYGR